MKLSRQDKQESGCTGSDTAAMSGYLQIKRKYIEVHEFKTLTFRHEASPRTKNTIVSSRPFNRCPCILITLHSPVYILMYTLQNVYRNTIHFATTVIIYTQGKSKV